MNKNKSTIFFITSEIPSLSTGSSVRSYHMLKELRLKGLNIKLFSLFDSNDIDSVNNLRDELGVEIHLSHRKRFNLLKSLFVVLKDKSIPYMGEFKESGLELDLYKELKKEKPDIIQLETLSAYAIIEKILSKIKNSKIKIILNMHDAEYPAFKEAINIFPFPKRLMGYYLLPNFQKIEIEALEKADHIFSCSEIDKKYFENFVDQEKISVVPNGVESENFKISKTQGTEYSILFMGLLSYPPNADGMKFYFKNIHPRIKMKFKNVRVYLIGKNPPKWLKRLAKEDKNIIVTGFVKDVRAYIKKVKICICPLRYGSGTRLKILEYMAMAKPVVSTTKGAEGLDIENYKNILIADKPDEFSEKIIWLFSNLEEAKIIGHKGRQLVEKKYNWSKIVKNTQSIYEKLTRK